MMPGRRRPIKSLFGSISPRPAKTPVERSWETATEDDVMMCFRLLYGRQPTNGEWQEGLRHIGGSARDLVARHLTHPEVRGLSHATKNAHEPVSLAKFPGFCMYASAADAAVGKHVLAGSYEPDVTAVFHRHLRPGMGVLDIGANIGYFSMLSAAAVGGSGYVLAIEPNPKNTRLIEASRRQNGFDHVKIAQLAAAPEAGLLALHSSYSTGTTSGLPDGISDLLDTNTVLCAPPDVLVPPGQHIDLIKVDVDGADFNALLGCSATIARDRPIIVAEFAPGLLPGLSGVTGRDYLSWLMNKRYDISTIQLDGSVISVGGDLELVLRELQDRGTDHLDILATPA